MANANALLVLLAALVTGCVGAPAMPAGPSTDAPAARVLEAPALTPEERLELGSCYATFDDVADAWVELVGPLSAECRAVADSFEVRLVPVVPCKAPGGGAADGCTVHDERTVYILEDRSPAGQVFASTHEWVHVLAGCALGDSDHDHLEAVLWSLERGVLGLAVANPPVGPCVEAAR